MQFGGVLSYVLVLSLLLRVVAVGSCWVYVKEIALITEFLGPFNISVGYFPFEYVLQAYILLLMLIILGVSNLQLQSCTYSPCITTEWR